MLNRCNECVQVFKQNYIYIRRNNLTISLSIIVWINLILSNAKERASKFIIVLRTNKSHYLKYHICNYLVLLSGPSLEYRLLYRDVYDSKRKLTMQLTFRNDNSHQENFLSAFCIVLNMSIYDKDFHVGLYRFRILQQ